MIRKFLLSVAALGLVCGCQSIMTGAGEFHIGMRNDNLIVIGHTVDGDKEGKQASRELKVKRSVLNSIFKDEEQKDDGD